MKYRWIYLLALMATGMLLITPAVAQNSDQVEATALLGQAGSAPGRIVVLNDLPQYNAPARSSPVAIPLLDGVNPAARQPNVPATDLSGLAPSPVVAGDTNTTPGAKFFLGKDESSCGGLIPSDQALATSGVYVVQVINSCINVTNGSGVPFAGFPKSLTAFFFDTSTDLVGDVRALYDFANGRWIIEAEDFTTNEIDIAASATSNPTGSYFVYHISGNVGGLAGSADFPMMGQSLQEPGDKKGAIYISFDRFNPSFTDNVIWILPKTPIYAGLGFGFRFFFNLNARGVTVDHVQPANDMGKGDRPRAEFLVNTFDFNSGCSLSAPCNGLVVWSLYNGVPTTGTNPSLTGVIISTPHNYVQPVTAAQPGAASGTRCALNTGFVGISGGITYSAGDVYAAATTRALNGQASDGWEYWQIHPYLNSNGTINSAAIRNEICWGCNGFGGNATYSEYYPTIQPDGEGNVTVAFNFSSNVNLPSLAYVSQRDTQPTGSFPDGGLVGRAGQGFYCQLDQFNRNRWGDYTATSPKGTGTPPAFWFAGQFSESTGGWGTAIGTNTYASPTVP